MWQNQCVKQCILHQLLVRDMFGLDLLDGSGGLLARGSLYVILGSMEDKGLIQGSETPPYGRRKYSITGLGRAAARPMLPEAHLMVDGLR